MQQNLIDAARAVIAADRAGELTDELITALEKELTRSETPRGRGTYGVDTGYFDRKLARVIPALDNYTPGDLAREFARMAAVADREAAFVELAPAGFAPAAGEPVAPVVPDVWVSEMYDNWIDGYTPGAAYRKGWNDCRGAMLTSKERQHD